MSFDQIFELAEHLAKQDHGVFSAIEDLSANLYVTGNSSGTIGISLKNGILNMQKTPIQPCDAQISASADDLYALISGNLNPMMAVMTGRLKVSGDMGKLMKIMSKFKK